MQAWVISVPMVISSRNVQNPLLSRFSCFIRSHLQEYSYHPVSLSLLCSLSLILLLSLPPSFFFLFFFYHSFFIALSVPSILLPARLHLFFLTSLSFLPVFQPWLFPPSFSVTLTLSRPISLTLRALLSFPLYPSFCFSVMPHPHQHLSPFSSPLLLFLECVIFHTSCHHPSLTDPVCTLSPYFSSLFLGRLILTSNWVSADRLLLPFNTSYALSNWKWGE